MALITLSGALPHGALLERIELAKAHNGRDWLDAMRRL